MTPFLKTYAHTCTIASAACCHPLILLNCFSSVRGLPWVKHLIAWLKTLDHLVAALIGLRLWFSDIEVMAEAFCDGLWTCIRAFVLCNPLLDIRPLSRSEKSIEFSKRQLLINVSSDIHVAITILGLVIICTMNFVCLCVHVHKYRYGCKCPPAFLLMVALLNWKCLLLHGQCLSVCVWVMCRHPAMIWQQMLCCPL